MKSKEKTKLLLGSDSDSDSDSDSSSSSSSSSPESSVLKINKKFAREYTSRKQSQELKNAEQNKRGGGVRFSDNIDIQEFSDDDGSSSTSEEEDEDGELLTNKMNLKIFQTIKALQNKDDSIYNKDTQFFSDQEDDTDDDSSDDDDEGETVSSKRKGSTKQTLKSLATQDILNKMGSDDNNNKEEDNDDDEDGEPSGALYSKMDSKSVPELAYDEEQRALRSEFLSKGGEVGGGNDDDDSDDDSDASDFLLKKKKNQAHESIDEDEVKIIQQVEQLASDTLLKGRAGKKKKSKQNKSNDKSDNESDEEELQDEDKEDNEDDSNNDDNVKDPWGKLQNANEFLFDYIKNKRWVDKMPTSFDPLEDDDDDADDVDRMDDFESKYNFRFEEERAANKLSESTIDLENENDNEENGRSSINTTPRIVSYARNSIHTSRKVDDKNRKKRLARKERKEQERKQMEEKLKRLKNAKRVELENKMKQIMKVSGGGQIPTDVLDRLLEADYDDGKFDEAMQEYFNDDSFNDAENVEDIEALRKEILEEEGIEAKGDDGWYNEDAADGEDEAYAPDGSSAYYDGGDEEGDEEPYYNDEENEEVQEPKQKKKKSNSNKEELPEQLRTKIQDELYKLDYEDMIGDMPCRFKYKQVQPNSYGLSTEEILFAKDSTLKEYVSLKKMAPYHSLDHSEAPIHPNKRKRARQMIKQDINEMLDEYDVKQQELNREKQKLEYENKEADAMAGADGEKKKKKRRQKKKSKKDSSGDDDAKMEQEPGPEEESKKMDLDSKDIKESGATTEDEEQSGKKKKRTRKKKGKKLNKNLVQDNTEAEPEGVVAPANNNDIQPAKKKKKRSRKKANKKVMKMEEDTGISASRLASYGLA